MHGVDPRLVLSRQPAECNLNGANSAKVNVSGILDIDASGASIVRYIVEPQKGYVRSVFGQQKLGYLDTGDKINKPVQQYAEYDRGGEDTPGKPRRQRPKEQKA